MPADNKFRPLFHPVHPGLVVRTACASHCCNRVDQLGVSIGGRTLLHDVSLHLHCGEIVAVVGPNGAGKSTLLRALIGEIPFTGHVEFLNAEGHIFPAPRVGYVPQNPRFEPGMPVSVLDLFASALSRFPTWLGVRARLRQKVETLLAQVEVSALIDRPLGTLSGGELQRVLLALALEPQPNLLLLDEPSSGMDANGRRMFYRTVDQVRRTHDLAVLLVSHDYVEVGQFADRMLLLQGTILLDGKPSEVLQHPRFLELLGGVGQ